MPTKTVIADFGSDRFRVENTWFKGAKLSHNDALVATSDDMLALDKRAPIMSADVAVNGQTRKVEVFAWAILTVKLQIRIDGQFIGGDKF